MAYSYNPFSPILDALKYAAELNERRRQEEEERKKWAQQLALQQQKAKSEEDYWKQSLALRRREGESEREYKERLLALRRQELNRRYPTEKTEEEITDIIGDPRNTYIAATNLLKQQGINSIDDLFNTYDKDKALQIIKTTLWRAFSSNDTTYNKKLMDWLDTWGGIVSSYGIQGGGGGEKREKRHPIAEAMKKIGGFTKQVFTPAPGTAAAEQGGILGTLRPPAGNKPIENKTTGLVQRAGRKTTNFRRIIRQEKKKKPLEGEIMTPSRSGGATGGW